MSWNTLKRLDWTIDMSIKPRKGRKAWLTQSHIKTRRDKLEQAERRDLRKAEGWGQGKSCRVLDRSKTDGDGE